ncbi:MAG: hypothetical protein LKG25_03295 [Prevotella sp.]|jgi:hypothetical protein|nr:hypothetical protein [Prevotella sp.]MCI1281604.1 hypothetical protein [Prevotella sp.]
MALRFSIKNKEDKDEKTAQAEEFINRITSTQLKTDEVKELPKTEIPK